MHDLLKKCKIILPVVLILFLYACERKDIAFGTIPENNHTRLVFTDTISVNISTVLTDSFATNGDSVFLIGRYKDPYLGAVSARSFFQMTVPSSLPEIPATAKFDSLSLIVRLNHYYYGDTSKTQTIQVYELANAISYSYNNKLYNTSDVAVKPSLFGSKTLKISPNANDSIIIRLDDNKGLELFSKLRQSAADITTENDFLNYFRGISIAMDNNDSSAVYGLSGAAGSVVMRVHYHNTIPYPESQYTDFTSLANDYAFNQILTDRSATGLIPGTTGTTEIVADKTNGFSFTQPGTGLLLKMTFPALSSVLNNENIVKLLKAELLIRPTYLSFDKQLYKLPAQLYLAQTDATNSTGNTIMDSTGYSVQYASPVIDDIYGENNYYRFNITSYINELLYTTGSSNRGVFVINNPTSSKVNVDRLVVNNLSKAGQPSQLLLSFMIINQ